RNHTLTEKYPGKFITNGRFDPREGDAGLRQLEADVERYGLKGVKLYTAEWYEDSRGYKLSEPEAYRFLARAQELGIKNVHVHKRPAIWPLHHGAIDFTDVKYSVTVIPKLNCIVEHVLLPRIEAI